MASQAHSSIKHLYHVWALLAEGASEAGWVDRETPTVVDEERLLALGARVLCSSVSSDTTHHLGKRRSYQEYRFRDNWTSVSSA